MSLALELLDERLPWRLMLLVKVIDLPREHVYLLNKCVNFGLVVAADLVLLLLVLHLELFDSVVFLVEKLRHLLLL